MSIWALLERRQGEGNDAHPRRRPLMAHAPRKNTWNEQLWNVSLLPTPAPRRPVEAGNAPTPHDRGTALRTAALLSLVESEAPATLARAA
jgi:hypothetical protein